MKNMKKVFALVLALVMVLALSATAFAQTVAKDPADSDNATITISNAATNETYRIAKLFDATVTGTTGGSIAYQGDIPAELTDYFSKDAATGKITATDALDFSSAAVQSALKTWANNHVTAEATCTSAPLVFTGLPYGYYIVTTTQGQTLVTVDSTNPNVTVIDKNTTPPINHPKKYANNDTADDNNVNIGESVTYTIEFETANYVGTDKILSYIITDDFATPALSNVNVTSITIGGADYKVNGETPQFVNGKITIPWVDDNNNSLYANKAKIVITYTAIVSAQAVVDGSGNTNKATITYTKENQPPTPPPPVEVEDTVYTYAIAIKKVDQDGQPLAGAKFKLPFYVNATPADDGAYIYAGTAAGEGLVDELTTPANGLIIVKGVKNGSYTINETEAPNGYNKLAGPVSVTAVKTGKTTTSTKYYLDNDGNIVGEEFQGEKTEVLVEISALAATPVLVVNKTGTELPETGGIGTTIFYVVGGMMMAAAVVLLITKKRVGNVK